MSEKESTPEKLAQSLTIAQLEKLNLEIQSLKDKNRWQDSVAKLTPLVSVLIAVGGFLFGIYQYRSQEEKSRSTEEIGQKIRVQGLIREDLNQILQFPGDKQQTVSKVEFSLEDLKQLLTINTSEAKSASKRTQDEQRKITPILVRLILDDCNFNEPREVGFVFSVFNNWDDYKDYVVDDRDTIRNLLLKYGDGLIALRDKAPCYVTRIKYSEDKNGFVEPDQCSKSDETDLRHFEDLVDGFAKHFKLLKPDSDLREYAIKIFQASICNRTLTKQEFGIDFDPKSDPVIFQDCYRIHNK